MNDPREVTLSDPIEKLARAALIQPEDSWFGNERLWVDCGMSGWSKTRDSRYRELANFESVVEELTERFGPEDSSEDSTNVNQWWINGATHWACGYVDQIMVRILINMPPVDEDSDTPDYWTPQEFEAYFVEDNITEVFKLCIENLKYVDEQYPVLNESKLSEMEYKGTLKNMSYNWPSWATTDAWSQNGEVFSWLWQHDVYAGGEDSDWYSEDEIGVACVALGFIIPEEIEECEEWVESILMKGGVEGELLRDIGLWFNAVEYAEKYKDQGSLL